MQTITNPQALNYGIYRLLCKYRKYCYCNAIVPTKQGFYVWAKNQ